jgi:hypothetical protein
MSVHLVDRFVLNSGVERAVVTVVVVLRGVAVGTEVEGAVLVSLIELASLATICDLAAKSRARSSLALAMTSAAYCAALDMG